MKPANKSSIDPAIRVVRELAPLWHDVVSRSALEQHGCSRHQIDRLIARDILTTLHPGVFMMGTAPPTFLQRAAAAVLATGGEAALSHRAACALFDIDVPPLLYKRQAREGPGGEDLLDLTVTRTRYPRTKGVRIHRSTDLTPDQVTTCQLLPVTDPYRLAIDLGKVAPEWAVAQAIEQLANRGLVVPSILSARIDQLGRKGRRGLGVARRVMERRALGDAIPESMLEVKFAELCRAHGLTMPDYQYRILVEQRWRRIDFAYPELHIAIELQGYRYHSDKKTFEDDKVRTNQLQLLGWTVLQFTWTDVVERPAYVAATIRHAIRQAER